MLQVSRVALGCLSFLISVGTSLGISSPHANIAYAQDGDSAQRPVLTPESLRQNPDLQVRRSAHGIGVPLGEMLQQWEGGGITLTCSVTCRDQKIQIHFKDRPLHEIMNAVADLLLGTWEKRGEHHYELVMDRDALDRRRQWWLLFERARSAGLQSYRDEALKAMRGAKADGIFTDSDLREEMAARAGFFAALPGDLQERIAGHLNDKALLATGGLRRFGSSDDEVGVDVRMSELPESAQTMIRNRVSGMAMRPVNVGDSTIRFANGGFVIYANVIGGPGGNSWSGTAFSVSPRHSSISGGFEALAELDQRQLPAKVDALGKNAPLLWRQLAEFQKTTFWKNTTPKVPLPHRGNLMPPLRPEVISIIAEVFDIEYVSDYYSRPGAPLTPSEAKSFREYLTGLRSSEPSLKSALEESLNRHAVQYDVSWKRDTSGLLLIRSNRWYRDDRLEVPAPYLRRYLPAFAAAMKSWSERTKQWKSERSPSQGGNLPPQYQQERLDFEANVNATLTLWQISNGLRWAVADEYWIRPESASTVIIRGEPVRHLSTPFQFAADSILNRRVFLPFYRSLDTAARGLLLRGELPHSAVPLALRDQALAVSAASALPEGDLARATIGVDRMMRRLTLTTPPKR